MNNYIILYKWKIGKYFNNHVIKLEQELYIQEGLENEKIKYKDNKAVIRLIDGDKEEFKKEMEEMKEKIGNNINNNFEILKLIDENDSNYKNIL